MATLVRRSTWWPRRSPNRACRGCSTKRVVGGVRSSCGPRSWRSSGTPRLAQASWSSRSPTGTGCVCTGARSDGPGCDEPLVVLAARRGSPDRLRGAARSPARARPATRRSGRGPVRPPRTGRVDHLAGQRAELRRRAGWCVPSGVESSRRSASRRACRVLPVPARCCGATTVIDHHERWCAMKVALYARVSTERQAERGTIGSQLAVLREQVNAGGHEVAAEYLDDGHSGARLDRPGLDALRDGAEAGLFEAVWCLSPDRLARAYAYQVLVLEELTRFGVKVHFSDAPDPAADDPQAVLLTQVQGVIAEYEKAKIAERYRRGKLFRARAGEITTWKAPYGYRRIARSAASGPAHLEIYEPEAAVVRRIFTERVGGTTIREICRQLNTDTVPSPTGRPTWGHSTVSRLLRNEAFIGRVNYNRTETLAAPGPARRTRQVARPREEWIAIDCPPIVTDQQFQAASRVAHDNSQWSPRRSEPGAFLLKGPVKCGACRVGTNCHKMRGRNGTWHRYYYCRNHDPLRAGGEQHRCPERNIRTDALDEFVFDHVRAALTEPAVLLAGEQAVALTQPTPDDELLAAELARLDRKIDNATAEQRRLIDLFQAGPIDMPGLQRRA